MAGKLGEYLTWSVGLAHRNDELLSAVDDEVEFNTLEKILERTVDVNDARDFRGRTALHIACAKGHVQAVKKLLHHGASIALRSQDERTALHWACTVQNDDIATELANLLIEHGATVDALDHAERTPFLLAVGRGLMQCTQELIRAGANLTHKDLYKWSALHYAAKGGEHSLLHTLLEYGADINSTNARGWTALHESAFGAHTACVRLLLRKGADFRIVDQDGFTPLQRAPPGPSRAILRLWAPLRGPCPSLGVLAARFILNEGIPWQPKRVPLTLEASSIVGNVLQQAAYKEERLVLFE